ncbi:MAG: hypothetical protein HZB31_14765 [Nitrospirae bacterium]|nr:hypothetical protein [Nitrospirota bacterium]
MKKNIIARTKELLVSVVFILLITSASVHAGPVVTQTFNLHPGWNAIFLEVQPEQKDMEILLQFRTRVKDCSECRASMSISQSPEGKRIN